jgi:hypothetical protein
VELRSGAESLRGSGEHADDHAERSPKDGEGGRCTGGRALYAVETGAEASTMRAAARIHAEHTPDW